jgi:hypothetical protein
VTMLVNVIVELIQLILAIVLAVVSLYAGFFAFNRIVKGIDVPSELTKGNKAIGLFVASVFIGISVTVVSCIQGVLVGCDLIVPGAHTGNPACNRINIPCYLRIFKD